MPECMSLSSWCRASDPNTQLDLVSVSSPRAWLPPKLQQGRLVDPLYSPVLAVWMPSALQACGGAELWACGP